MNIYLFFGLTFLFVLLAGKLFQKIRIPWIFSALFLGTVLAFHNPFQAITDAPIFEFFANLGMYFLLFIIGFEINLKMAGERKSFIFKSAFMIIFLEALFGGIFIHYIFHYNWFISFIVALSFSTVGEAILVPILDEFDLIKSRLGQTIISIGVLDDIIEILILIAVILFVGAEFHGHFDIWLIVFSLLFLFLMAFGLTKLKKQSEKFYFTKIETLFLFVIAVFFLFLGVGAYAEAAALGAILAGVGLRTFIPDERLKVIENEIKSVCYGLFAPIFFLWVGLGLDMSYLVSYPALVVMVVLVSSGAKYLASYIAGRKELGKKNAFLLGTGLSVRFSTSIVVIKIFHESRIIDSGLYSVIVASSIIFTFLIPFIFSRLLRRYRLEIS